LDPESVLAYSKITDLTLISSSKILGQFVTHIHVMTSTIKTITSVLKASTDIITNIPAPHLGLAEIVGIMSV
jgi:hypothetical protein